MCFTLPCRWAFAVLGDLGSTLGHQCNDASRVKAVMCRAAPTQQSSNPAIPPAVVIQLKEQRSAVQKWGEVASVGGIRENARLSYTGFTTDEST